MFALCLVAFFLFLGVNTFATPVSKRDFGPVSIFVPPTTYTAPRTMYGRHLLLNDTVGTLLSTWENYDWSGKPYHQIFRSTDHGYTWAKLSEVRVSAVAIASTDCS
jgi:hypothetical protein